MASKPTVHHWTSLDSDPDLWPGDIVSFPNNTYRLVSSGNQEDPLTLEVIDHASPKT